MNIIPWRLKSFASRRFPLATHLLLNWRLDRKDEAFWDAELERDWDSEARNWPTKNRLIERSCDPNASVLDVGCGTGQLLRYLKSKGFQRLHAYDHSAYAVKRLQAEGITGICGKLPEISLPPNTFDVVIASQVLEHIIRRKRFVAEMRRILKPGGKLFVFVPNDTLDPLSEPSHVAIYTRKRLRVLLSRCFKIIEIDEIIDDNHPMSVLCAICQKTAECDAGEPK